MRIRSALAALLLLSACEKAEAPKPVALAKPTAPTKTAASPVKAGLPLVVVGANGQPEARLEKRAEGGYTLRDPSGPKLGKVSVSADRVKAKDIDGNLKAKVKKKDGGFKLMNAADETVWKAKIKDGSRIKIKDAAGTEIASMSVADARKGTAVLALPGLDKFQRAALSVFIFEVW